jgi:hypothetical protein
VNGDRGRTGIGAATGQKSAPANEKAIKAVAELGYGDIPARNRLEFSECTQECFTGRCLIVRMESDDSPYPCALFNSRPEANSLGFERRWVDSMSGSDEKKTHMVDPSTQSRVIMFYFWVGVIDVDIAYCLP